MIVVGMDPHKSSLTAAGVDAATGEQRSCETVAASVVGFARVLDWARGLDEERVWAVEDCRQVSARFERFLLAHGERVVRVAPTLMASVRRGVRERGKSDPIDARAVAVAALREGLESLPIAQLAGRDLEVRLLLDHHDDLVAMRGQSQQRLRWHLHDLYGELGIPPGGLDRTIWLDRIARRLGRDEQSARVRIARSLLITIRTHTRDIRQLEHEITQLVNQLCPQLTAEVGCGPLTAAKLIGEIAGANRFATDAKLARSAGVAPIPASSGRHHRHRLDRGGNRQLNLALHRFAVNRARHDPQTAAYLARKQAEGKNRREALRCLKRHLARRVWHLLNQPPTLT